MKTKLLVSCILFVSIMLLFNACSDDDNVIKKTAVTVQLKNPEGISSSTLTDISISLKEANTGKTTQLSDLSGSEFTIELEAGTYDATLEGKISYTAEGNTVDTQVRAYKESVTVIGETLTASFDLFIYAADKAGFVIQEVNFAGSLTNEGKQTFDQYFKIYNNSDEVLYADGLFIAQSQFSSIEKYDYSPNIMNEALTISAIIVVPGSGTDHPIQPKESFIVAIDGINHKELNSNSIDLSIADFEIVTEHPTMEDNDNPEVPNMENVLNHMIIHNQGFKAYALGRLGVSVEKYLSDYVYTCTWVFAFEEWEFDEEDDYYKLPNEWIMDAVNLSIESDFQWIVTAPTLDMGWTYCAKGFGDATRYGKSVIRKVAGKTPEGADILMDTNNSKVDFTPAATPSLKK